MYHDTTIRPAGFGDAVLRPDGWHQNWFSGIDTTGSRPSASVTWDRSGLTAFGRHTVSLTGDVQYRTMTTLMQHQGMRIDDLGRLTRRSIRAGAVADERHDTRGGGGVRDLWDVTPLPSSTSTCGSTRTMGTLARRHRRVSASATCSTRTGGRH
jgi:hypothetical protein